jgi:ABC-type nickel/cobalt efflux system permease component RcnA
MHPSPNLQQMVQQTQEAASKCKDQRLGLVFQVVSSISVAALGVGAVVHLLREMLRHPQHHKAHMPETAEHEGPNHRRWSERTGHEDSDAVEDQHHRQHVRRNGSHGHHRG